MTEINKQILAKGNAAIAAGDNEGFLALCTEGIRWNFIGDRILNGKEEVRGYMAKTYREPPKFNVIDLVADGDLLTAIGEISLKNEQGQTVKYAYCDVWRFEGEKLAELRAFVVEI